MLLPKRPMKIVADDRDGPRPGALVMVGSFDADGTLAWEAGTVRKCGCCAALFDARFGAGKSIAGEPVIEFAPHRLVPDEGTDDEHEGATE